MENVLYQTIRPRILFVNLQSDRRTDSLTDTPKKANASAIAYSLIETVKTNGLSVYALSSAFAFA